MANDAKKAEVAVPKLMHRKTQHVNRAVTQCEREIIPILLARERKFLHAHAVRCDAVLQSLRATGRLDTRGCNNGAMAQETLMQLTQQCNA